MPFRIIRVLKPPVKKEDVLQVAVATSRIAKELSSLSMFPPMAATISVLLVILDTLKSVNENRDGCINLAHRCAQILLDLNDLMQGRWHSVPPALWKNLERYTEILQSIHTFMTAQANEKWAKRLLRKGSIEASLADFNKKLSDASQMFQIAMLIDIGHHILPHAGGIQQAEPESMEGSKMFKGQTVTTEHQPPAYSSRQGSLNDGEKEADELKADNEAVSPSQTDLVTLVDEPVQDADEDLISDAALEDHGFRRYHTSEVRMTGRSKIKSGWWADTAVADVSGQASLVKYYEGNSKNDALKRWLRDVKALQNIFHPNLPHMTGYSVEDCPTPFVLLSDARTNAPDKLINHTLKNEGVAACLTMLGKYYSDIADAATYVRRQLNLTDSQVQDFVEKTDFRVNSSQTIIMGLPPPQEGSWTSWRNYDLSHTLMQATMSMLPGKGSVQSKLEHYQDGQTGQDPLKIAHLISLARGLLSVDSNSCSPLVSKLLEDGDSYDLDSFTDTPKITMKQLRDLNLDAGIHNFYWTEMSAIPPHKFVVGDYGYVPKNAHFADFVKLGNIYTDNIANIPITSHAHGTQFCWDDRPIHQVEIEKVPLPGDVYCWPIGVPRGAQIDCQIEHSERMSNVNDAWRVLSESAKALGKRFNVAPEDLILVTAAGTNQNFYIKDFQNQVAMRGIARQPPPFRPAHSFMNMNLAAVSVPTIMYLLTSPGADHQPFWSHQLMYVPNAPRPSLKNGWVQNIGYCHGFVQWIQLLKEDFIEVFQP